MESVDRADPFCPFCDLRLTWDAAPDFLEGVFLCMVRGEDCCGEGLTLLDGGLGVVRLIDGDETERLVLEDSDRSAGVLMDRTRERGVEGGNGAAF